MHALATEYLKTATPRGSQAFLLLPGGPYATSREPFCPSRYAYCSVQRTLLVWWGRGVADEPPPWPWLVSEWWQTGSGPVALLLNWFSTLVSLALTAPVASRTLLFAFSMTCLGSDLLSVCLPWCLPAACPERGATSFHR